MIPRMRSPGRIGLLVCLLAVLALPSASPGSEPPNSNDPCSKAGRNVCGTTGVGFYSTYRYGIRWFGDYRGAVVGHPVTFCIDLGYWYPSRASLFHEVPGPELRNRANEVVPVGKQQRMAYAIWAFGRTHDAKRQAAVMLYVHSLMGDSRPGEVDPAAVDKTLVPIYAQIAHDAPLYHGPYRIESHVQGALVVGEEATAKVRVVSAAATPMPDLPLGVSAQGASIEGAVRTDGSGVATVT